MADEEHHPIEFDFPDIARWRRSASGAAFVHVLESGVPGPVVMVNALTHGNEVSGAIVVDALLSAGLKPTARQPDPELRQRRGLSELQDRDAVQVAHARRGFQPRLGPHRRAAERARRKPGR
jgi:hypothetical protein